MNNALALYYLRKIKYIKDKGDSLYVPVVMTHADIGTAKEKDKLYSEFRMLYELLYNSGVLPDIKEYEKFLQHKYDKIDEINKRFNIGEPLLLDCDPYKLDFFEPYIEKYEKLIKDEKEGNKKSRYKCNPKLQVYDEFGYESSDKYMNELKKDRSCD